MLNRYENMLIGDNQAARSFPWTLGILVFLATLVLAITLILSATADKWEKNVSGTSTVQVPDGPRHSINVSAAIDYLRSFPGVVSAKLISELEVGVILQPWLGSDYSGLNLSLPSLIDLKFQKGREVDKQSLIAGLERVAPGATVDDHRIWLQKLADFIEVGKTITFIILTLILFSIVVTVVFTTRAGLAIQKDVVEVLHLIGAQDSYVALQYQVHALKLAIYGSIIGFGLGAVLIFFVRFYWGNFGIGFLPEFTFSWEQWLGLATVPIVAIVLVIITVGYTVMKVLGRMV